MMKINLIRGRKARRLAASDRPLIVMGVAVVVAIGAMVVATISATNEADRAVRASNALRDDIERMKTELGDYDKVKAERVDLLKQQKTIDALKTGRTGPVYVMRELSEILTPRKGPTFDRPSYEERLRRDPNVGFNANWDPRRVWLESFEETQRKVRIQGAARTNDDVAEFLKRLQLSVFFAEVTPESTTQIADNAAAGGAKRVSFHLNARVVY
ncbi:MAG TPA: PilN domain-containing protein [Polyangia bacterium]|jgi:type IV pilus assembly protein PilN|nr:PilN domain-containing protein [Polyangia bacterium]